MTKEQVIELAKQAGMAPLSPFLGIRQADEQAVIKFATLVRNAALEEAAQATIPHSDVIAAAQAIRNLKEPTP